MTIVRAVWLAVVFFLLPAAQSFSQERVKIAYSSADASNTVWFTALDAGLYRKHGLDVELVFIQSSTTSTRSTQNCMNECHWLRAKEPEQIKEALSRKPGATLRFEEMVDDSIVRELEKSGFIDKVYK